MTTMTRPRRETLAGMLDVREERQHHGALLEMRTRSDGTVILEGYAATFDAYDVNGGPSAGGWVEQLGASCFDDTLAEQPDVQLLINHEGLPLARTTAGNMKLSADRHGLRVWAQLDGTDPDVQRIVPKMKPQANGRAILDEMSFAFRVKDQEWDTSYSHRTINKLTLQKGDVSVVNYGMNPGTRAVLGVGALAQLSSSEMAELRKLDQKQLQRAAQVLASVVGYPAASSGPTRADKDTSKPYGDVTYADPGYKSDGKKRYPIDSAAHVKAAWSYINMPKNHAGYTAEEVTNIKNKIKAAAKKFGIEISDDKKSAAGIHHIDTVARADGNTTLVAVLHDGSKVILPSQRAAADPDQTPKYSSRTYDWKPGNVSDDPHDEPYDEGMMGAIGTGPLPENIHGDSGDFDGTPEGECDPDEEAEDPHDCDYDKEMLSMDPHDDPHEEGPYPMGSKVAVGEGSRFGPEDYHDTPYDVGGTVGSVGGDRPNYGDFPQGKVADNIHTTGPMLGKGTGVPSGNAGQPVGTEPVDAPGHQAYDWTSGTGEPSIPAQELDARAAGGLCPDCGAPMGSDHHCTRGDDWAPTNIICGDKGSDEECDNDMGEAYGAKVELDLCLAESLDRTILHAYQAATGAKTGDVRKLLVVARRQLNSLRNINPQRKPAPSEVARRLAELRKEVGAPDTATVSGGLAWLRSAGPAPIGYRGLLKDASPVTAAQRLERDAAAARARQAAAEAERADARLAAVERERELDEVIKRNQKKVV